MLGDGGGGSVADGAVGEGDGVADLDLVAGAQRVGAAGELEGVVAELPVPGSQRLGVGVELVEVLVGGLGDHERPLAVGAVAVGGLERGAVPPTLWSGAMVQPSAVGVALERLLVLAVAEAALVALVVGVERPQVGGELGA